MSPKSVVSVPFLDIFLTFLAERSKVPRFAKGLDKEMTLLPLCFKKPLILATSTNLLPWRSRIPPESSRSTRIAINPAKSCCSKRDSDLYLRRILKNTLKCAQMCSNMHFYPASRESVETFPVCKGFFSKMNFSEGCAPKVHMSAHSCHFCSSPPAGQPHLPGIIKNHRKSLQFLQIRAY